MTHWIQAVGFAALCGLLEGWLSGPRPFVFLASLRQPRWGLPIAGWLLVGAAFYVIMTYAASQTIRTVEHGVIPLATVMTVMIADGFWNYLLFRRKRFDWAYWYLFPYAALVSLSAFAVFEINRPAGILIAAYLIFLPYDFALTKALVRLNPQYTA
jgi:tryptophan-rich sensory protein